MKRMNAKQLTLKILYWTAVVIVLVAMLMPLWYMFSSSLKRIVDLMNPERIFIFQPIVDNYINVFVDYDFARPIWNSLVIGVVSTVLACLLGLPAAYSIARYKKRKTALLVLSVRIIPGIMFLIPWYIIFARLGLIGTYTSMILAHLLISLPLIVWIVTPYFQSIPRELEEAAFIDGSSVFRSFVQIMIPLSKPGIFTASILAFIFSWNNFMFALVLTGRRTRTLPMAIFNFMSDIAVDWAGLMAAGVVITAPVIIISILLQKYVVSGLTAGAVKG